MICDQDDASGPNEPKEAPKRPEEAPEGPYEKATEAAAKAQETQIEQHYLHLPLLCASHSFQLKMAS